MESVFRGETNEAFSEIPERVKEESPASSTSGSSQNPLQPEVKRGSRVPKRILHFSDGTLEEYSSDEEDGRQLADQLNAEPTVDPQTLTLIPRVWYHTLSAGNKALEVCDTVGESLANFFGITTPKYQYEIDEYKRMMEEMKEEEKQSDIEMAGWREVPLTPEAPVVTTVNEESRPPRDVASSEASSWQRIVGLSGQITPLPVHV